MFARSVPLSANASQDGQIYVQDNFAIQVQDIDRNNFTGEPFSINLEALFNLTSETTMNVLSNTTASIQVSPSIFDNEDNSTIQRLSYSVFLTDTLFQTSETADEDVEIVSIILGVHINMSTDSSSDDIQLELTEQVAEVRLSSAFFHLHVYCQCPIFQAGPQDNDDKEGDTDCAHYDPMGNGVF